MLKLYRRLRGCWSRRLLREARWRMDVRLGATVAGRGRPWVDEVFLRLARLERRLADRTQREEARDA